MISLISLRACGTNIAVAGIPENLRRREICDVSENRKCLAENGTTVFFYDFTNCSVISPRWFARFWRSTALIVTVETNPKRN